MPPGSATTDAGQSTGQQAAQPSSRAACGCERCTLGLIDPPALARVLPLIEERLAQYEAGRLQFCDCAAGQALARHYAGMSANPYGAQIAAAAAARRTAYLEKIDGLKHDERGLTLDRYRVSRYNRKAVDAVREGVERRAGLITVYGAFGVGKSALLMAAVNEMRGRDQTAVYTTVADLLSWLRAAFDPAVERDPEDQSFARRWDLLVNCRCLALDELTAFSITPWAEERFERLIDQRWRSLGDKLTLCAFNGDVANLPGMVESRLRDRRAALVEIAGIDMRQVYRGGE